MKKIITIFKVILITSLSSYSQTNNGSDLFISGDSNDWNITNYKNGIYWKWGGVNSPFGTIHATLLNIGQDAGEKYGFQISSDNNRKLKYRGFVASGNFNEWFDIYHSGNFNKKTLDSSVPNLVYNNLDNNFEADQTINGNIKLNNSDSKIYWDWIGRSIEQYSSGGSNRMIRFTNSMDSSNLDGGFNFTDHLGNSVLRINQHKVGIGTTKLDAKLTVAGDIHSREIKVIINAGADFVFENDYELPSLKSIETFINEKKHLPEIASAKEMKNKGLKLAEMNIKLLQKIEELTLYTINQQKQINILINEVKQLKKIWMSVIRHNW